MEVFKCLLSIVNYYCMQRKLHTSYETPTERNNRCLEWQFIRKMTGMPIQNALYISTLEYYELVVPYRNEIIM